MGKIVVFFLGIFIIASCESKTVFSETQALSGHWGEDETLLFTIPQLDSLKKYNVFVNVRNTNDYKYNNIFLIISMNFPHGKTLTDTLEYKMAYADGSWMGQGITDVKENKLFYKENVTFFEDGNYTLTVNQAMRNNGSVEGVTRLEGITDVGISIEEATKP
ncbi:gliding motility lipoprotein GldH [Aequorivita echinoideorum]|uniref:Gliding motility lipoprotein GldH n=1 Tax=Aequorivita echinoideorum TaxID=1549647 RepID=A0ABS5S3S7_9FLAO|nr:gliding motility lipoprotein GldH [Aequorivita echinoideorum]MBT0607861.1 gliding motility lipoprotein GldH [Aequorivita echinoideorum]